MPSSSRCPLLLFLGLFLSLIHVLVNLAGAQGIQTTPYSAANQVRGGLSPGGLDLAPSNPLGLPGASLSDLGGPGSILISPALLQGILPQIPNLQFGYLFSWGQNGTAGRTTVDYVLPISLGPDATVFGEAHSEWQDFWKTIRGSAAHRVDLSFGGGYRQLIRERTLLGVNAFSDSARLGGSWHTSGSLGLELACEIPGDDVIELNFNWYGKLFNSSVLYNVFRYGPSNYDLQVAYSHELWEGGPDLRLSASGYRFMAGSKVYGSLAGAELKSRDGVFVIRYDVGHDQLNNTYHTAGIFLNAGFQLENVLRGANPFTMPEPIFKSPRNFRKMLSRPVSRNYVLARPESKGEGGCGCGGSCHGLVFGATVAQHAAVIDTGLAYFIPFHTRPISVCDLNTNVPGNKRKMSIWFRGRVTGGSITLQINVMHAVPQPGGGYTITWSPVYGFWFPTVAEGYHDFSRIVDQVVLDENPGVNGIEVMRQAGLDAIGVFVQKAGGAGSIVGSGGEPWHFHVEFNEP